MNLFWRIVLFFFLGIGLSAATISIARADHSLDYRTKATEVERKYNLPAGLLEAICETESNWRNVKGQLDEIGVCQIRPGTVALHFPELAKASTGIIGPGDPHIAVVKYRLAVKGYIRGNLIPDRWDSKYKPYLPDKIKKFQADHKLTADGVIGPKTWQALVGTPFPKSTLEAKLWEPKENIEIAGRYLDYISRTLKTRNPAIMAAAYNTGPNSKAVQYMMKIEKVRQ